MNREQERGKRRPEKNQLLNTIRFKINITRVILPNLLR